VALPSGGDVQEDRTLGHPEGPRSPVDQRMQLSWPLGADFSGGGLYEERLADRG